MTKNKQKTYKVNYWQTDYGYFLIKAKDKDEARDIAVDLGSGDESFVSKSADFGVEDIEEQ